MSEIVASITSIAIAIVGLAIIATLVSQRANTANVIGAASQGFGYAIRSATGPVTGDAGGLGSFGSIGANFNQYALG